MATGRRTHSKSAGFSLIELLVAVAIIGLLAGAVTLSVVRADGGRRTVADTATMLHELFLHASVEAVMRGEVLAMELAPPDNTNGDGWHVRWLRWGLSGWQRTPTDQHSALLDLRLPDGMSPELQPEANRRQSAVQLTPGAGHNPAVIFYPTGDISTFELLLYDRQITDRVSSAGLGNSAVGYLEVRL